MHENSFGSSKLHKIVAEDTNLVVQVKCETDQTNALYLDTDMIQHAKPLDSFPIQERIGNPQVTKPPKHIHQHM